MNHNLLNHQISNTTLKRNLSHILHLYILFFNESTFIYFILLRALIWDNSYYPYFMGVETEAGIH